MRTTEVTITRIYHPDSRVSEFWMTTSVGGSDYELVCANDRPTAAIEKLFTKLKHELLSEPLF
jgi:hypothetical protein